MAVYDDTLATRYTERRKPDPRIADAIVGALGDARSVVNVGAGGGSYEPDDRPVTAVEPSAQMLEQRPRTAAPAVRAVAERLPFRDGAFDASLAVLTLHHWSDPVVGMAEMRRVAQTRTVVLTFDPDACGEFWITEYFPSVIALDTARFDQLASAMAMPAAQISVFPVPVPRDCTDGFLGAYWARPAAYLDPEVRTSISCFVRLAPGEVDAGIAALDADLRSGAWHERHGDLAGLEDLDLGYRLVVEELHR